MSDLQEYQIKKKEEEITHNLLRQGKVVNVYDVNSKVNDFFNMKTPGLPYTTPLHLEPYNRSDPNDLNNLFKDIESDLNTLYDVYAMQEEKFSINHERYNIEILKLNKEIDDLLSHTQILQEYSKKRISYYPFNINFYDLKYVNSIENIENNLYKTDCEFDFYSSTLRNKLTSNIDSKIDLNKATTKIYVNGREFHSESVKKLFEENINSMINIDVDGSENSKQIVDIIISFEKPTDISRVVLTSSSIINAITKVSVTSNSKDYIIKDTQVGSSINSFIFNKETATDIKITIEKDKYDLKYKKICKFFFGFVNISVYTDTYLENGIYVSEKIEFEDTVSDVEIKANHKIPPLTNIDYFVGYEDKNNTIEWFSIENNSEVDLKLLKKEEKILNYKTSEIFGDVMIDNILKNKCFKIHKLEDNSSINSIEIRAGYNQWLIEKLSIDSVDGKVNLKDYKKENIEIISPLDMTIPYIKLKNKNNYIVLTSYINCKENIIINNRFIDFDINEEDKELFDYKVVVNGKIIFSKNNLFNFRLNKGENTLKIMMCLNNHKDTNKLIKHNFNLIPYVEGVFAGPKMQRVSYNSLMKNIDKNSLNFYSTIYDKKNIIIVTKFDVNFVKNPSDPRIDSKNIITNSSEFFSVYIKYKYLTNNLKNSITNNDGNSNLRVRVMAKLNSLDKSVTPIINSIKVVGK